MVPFLVVLHAFVLVQFPAPTHMYRVGQNHIYSPFTTVILVVTLPKTMCNVKVRPLSGAPR